GRMGLADVDGEELGAGAVTTLQFFEGPKLGPIGPSGEAAEDEDDRLLAAELAQRQGACPIVRRQREVGRHLAHVGAFPQRADLAVEEAAQQHPARRHARRWALPLGWGLGWSLGRPARRPVEV